MGRAVPWWGWPWSERQCSGRGACVGIRAEVAVSYRLFCVKFSRCRSVTGEPLRVALVAEIGEAC